MKNGYGINGRRNLGAYLNGGMMVVEIKYDEEYTEDLFMKLEIWWENGNYKYLSPKKRKKLRLMLEDMAVKMLKKNDPFERRTDNDKT